MNRYDVINFIRRNIKMPATLVELAANIVSSHASVNEMSTEELLQEIQKVYATLQQLEVTGATLESPAESEKKAPTIGPLSWEPRVLAKVPGRPSLLHDLRQRRNENPCPPSCAGSRFETG
jgi:hypothetical protein